METTILALQAAKAALQNHGIEPTDRIINLSTAFKTKQFPEAEESIRPLSRLREPQLWEPEAADYLAHLLGKYGDAESGVLSTEAWAAHEADAEQQARETAGAEGIHDIIDRTKRTLGFIARYAKIFHANNPHTHLVVWAGTHYDTISPLVKDATDTPLDQYIPVANGGGVVIDLPNDGEARLHAQQRTVRLNLGKRAIGS